MNPAQNLIAALRRAGWERDAAVGSARIFRSPDGKRRVSVHVHPGKTFGPKLLKALLADIGLTAFPLRIVEDELRPVPSKGWAAMIRKVYEVDPMACPRLPEGEVRLNSAATGPADGSRVARPRAQAVLDVS